MSITNGIWRGYRRRRSRTVTWTCPRRRCKVTVRTPARVPGAVCMRHGIPMKRGGAR